MDELVNELQMIRKATGTDGWRLELYSLNNYQFYCYDDESDYYEWTVADLKELELIKQRRLL